MAQAVALEAKVERPSEVRNGLICAFVFAAGLLVAHPVVEMGFNDDWSYIKTAQVFAQTGHFVYNGWATAMLGWQVVWGGLFIKLVGFSFTIVRLSTVVVAMAAVVLFHAVLVRFGVTARNAVIGTLTLALSPLFLPLAASYMSDVPGLFVVLLCIYLCQRAIAAGSSGATIAWLFAAAVSNIAGGTTRQIAWLGALVIVPSAGWLLRRRRGVLLTTSLLWLMSAASVFACIRWFARQPYSIEKPFFAATRPHFVHLLFDLAGSGLCLLLLVFPILVAWLPKIRFLDHKALLRIGLVVLLWGFYQWATGWTMPWLVNLLRMELARTRADFLLWPKLLILPMWVMEAVSLIIIATALIFVEQHNMWSLGSKTVPQLWSLVRKKLSRTTSSQDMLWLFGPFSLCYFVLLIPSGYHMVIFDRYLLILMPLLITCLLKVYQEEIAPELPNFSVAVVAVFALLAIGGTHDLFAWERARLVAINELRASGIPRTQIQGGFEYDGWTQIEAGGYINDPRLKLPSGAFHPDTHIPPQVPPECRFAFAGFTPAIKPKYSIVFGNSGCLAPSKYPPVTYRTWLPPFKGTIYIQQIPNSSSDSEKPAPLKS